jgi:hypothetical protein
MPITRTAWAITGAASSPQIVVTRISEFTNGRTRYRATAVYPELAEEPALSLPKGLPHTWRVQYHRPCGA